MLPKRRLQKAKRTSRGKDKEKHGLLAVAQEGSQCMPLNRGLAGLKPTVTIINHALPGEGLAMAIQWIKTHSNLLSGICHEVKVFQL